MTSSCVEPSRAEPSRAATPPQPSHDLATLAFCDQTSSSVGKARFEIKNLVFRREGEVLRLNTSSSVGKARFEIKNLVFRREGEVGPLKSRLA